ncbi:uncharacterized protein PAC_10446 [Phialocephala subalpina]|uniref:Uncharacterized protein n=1 Tax=Phialocephala subalpina TaxID=576137 RepID=A0A1L7X6A2_9HELO|nr:uncharacterized protein PAC_10446 [Phialocephala subalpina]
MSYAGVSAVRSLNSTISRVEIDAHLHGIEVFFVSRAPAIELRKAFIILLGAIHEPSEKLPEKITLRTLVQLLVLVKKYEVMESIKPCAEAWILDLWCPGRLNLSTVVQRQTTHELTTQVLPIPGPVLGAMEATRRHSIRELLEAINKMLTAYSSGGVRCTSAFGASSQLNMAEKREAYDSLMLGSLIRSLSRHGLWPLPRHPYIGINLTQLAKIARDLQLMALGFWDVEVDHLCYEREGDIDGLDLSVVRLRIRSPNN